VTFPASRYLLLVTALATAHVACAASASIENFSAVPWANHDDLGVEVTLGDLVFSVPAGASMKGVTTPGGIMPGYRLDQPASSLSIKPATASYLTVAALSATDLFMMTPAAVVVEGYRGGTLVASLQVPSLWDDGIRGGVTVALNNSFTDLDELRIRGDVADPNASSVFFFLDAVTYRVGDVLTDSDSDGVPDIHDAFPDNGAETLDSDLDGMGDNFEHEYGLDPNVNDAGLDPDGDGRTNLEEFEDGTNPRVHNKAPAVISIGNGVLLDDDE